MGNAIVFFILAVTAIGAAAGMLISRNAVYSALYLILNLCTIAVLFLLLNAPFLAMVQITVYAGAIMVLFLFVIMLLGAEQIGGLRTLRGNLPPLALALVLLAVFAVVLTNNGVSAAATAPIDASPSAVGIALFQHFVLPFEITSVLLLVAMIGVVVLQTKKEKG
ncbi:MAG: NADH-quinone oxidoreductase subunit J [Anaerolineales bacterium]|nr:NADH-quinone oxidoreductase subunit J [Anaerolineales bacterium]MCB8952614.1 NADH-quinone oxidoreductase subunit J [Ardenticatenales bacterium]